MCLVPITICQNRILYLNTNPDTDGLLEHASEQFLEVEPDGPRRIHRVIFRQRGVNVCIVYSPCRVLDDL